jgi:acetyltransferase-like isoleucine patch superfamily enzyme/coenzyme F420-reducing hydrogenase beta subunit
MITITNKQDCSGCNACGDICSQNAISFKTDNEGFWYPEVDTGKCTNCGLCEKVCPVIHAWELKKNDFEKPDCYAAVHKNLEVVFDSNSGGLFSALAEKMYKDGGYVGGAVYNDDWSVSQFISDNKQDIGRLRNSKNPQSNFSGFFRRVREILNAGNKVLVCGCPCQMAAMRTFLGKNYENLVIVDFICRGICSPKVWRKHLDSLEKKYDSSIVHIKTKSKEYGWRKLTFKYIFANERSYFETKDENLFTSGYFSGVYCRPSCFDCRFKGVPRISDITIADFWGIEKVDKSLDNDLGTSLILVNSEKGRIYFDSIQQKIKYISIPFDSLPENQPLMTSQKPSKLNRDEFFSDLQNHDFITVANKYFPIRKSKKTKIKQFLRDCRDILKITRLKIHPVFQFVYYNFLRQNVKSNVFASGFLLPAPYTVIEIGKKAKVQLNARLIVGKKRVSKSRLETRLLIEDGGTLMVNRDFTIGYGADIEIFNGGTLLINGRKNYHSFTNINVTIICGDRIELGESVGLGRNVTIRDTNGNHYVSQRGYKTSRPVIIGNHVWLCEGCTIMPGVKIGDGSIVAAHSVVVTDVPPGCLVYGNPAKVIQTNICFKG